MQGLFGIDTPFYRFMLKFVQLMYLTFLWLVCSIPVITIGASTTALYYVCFKLAKDEESYLTRQFFNAFKVNFKQATCIWSIVFIIGCVLCVNNLSYWVFYEESTLLRLGFGLLTVMYFMMMAFLFPSLAKFENTIQKTFIFALLMSFKLIGWTCVLLLISVAIWAASMVLGGLPFISAMGLMGFMHAHIFNIIFDQFIEKQVRGA